MANAGSGNPDVSVHCCSDRHVESTVRARRDEVTFSYSRSRTKLESLATEAGGDACAWRPGDARQEDDGLLLAVHWRRLDDVLSQAGNLIGKSDFELIAADERRRH